MKSAHSLEYLAPHHEAILAAAALAGCDLQAVIPNATRLISFGDTKYGPGPVCVLDLIQTRYVYEPHVVWFPWTSAANRFVMFKWATHLMTETHHVLLNIEKSQISLFEHFTKRGYIRKIGVIEELPEVEEIHMYQIKRRNT